MKNSSVLLRLKGKTAVFIDWANVHGWSKSLKKDIDPRKLYRHLRTRKEILDIYFYFGTDTHPKSKMFLTRMKHLGYKVTTKPVKYIFVAEVNRQKIYKRKCDFDMEICIKVHELLGKDIQSFIFFTGDGDFEPLYQLLIGLKKQVIVVYVRGHLGREVWDLKRGIFKVELPRLMPS